MLEKLTLDAALGFLKRAWPFIIIAGLGIALAVTSLKLDNARTQLSSERLARSGVAGMLKTNDNWSDIGVALRALQETAVNQRQTLETISREALNAHQQSALADAALKQAQADNAKRFAAAQSEISRLEHLKSAGTCEADLKQIADATQAPWKDWK